MASRLTLRTVARSQTLWARPVSTSVRGYDKDDKSMYDKVKDKAGKWPSMLTKERFANLLRTLVQCPHGVVMQLCLGQQGQGRSCLPRFSMQTSKHVSLRGDRAVMYHATV